MPTVVGVRLRFSKTLWFDPAGSEPVEGDTVLVQTDRGTEVGMVVQAPHDVSASALPAALKPVLRVADEDDERHLAELEAKEAEAMPVFRDLVGQHHLDMKPIDVEYLFDGDKVTFYFSAEERVDFRELVKELATRFHARIDMRQVGVRDEARMVGGIGHCGQPLCCVRLGGDFQPVSIRMAKEQDLPLNPLKISGLCGRLMCCLRYEFDAYKDYKSRAPKRGALIETPVGSAKVTDLNTPKETVTVRTGDGTNVTVPLASMCCAKEGGGCPCSIDQDAYEQATGRDPLAAAVAARPEPTTPTERERPAKPSAEKAPAPEAPARKRRRRKSGGGGGGGEANSQPKESKQPPAAREQAGAKQQPAAQSGTDADKEQRTPRRRRRRRPGSGGSNGT